MAQSPAPSLNPGPAPSPSPGPSQSPAPPPLKPEEAALCKEFVSATEAMVSADENLRSKANQFLIKLNDGPRSWSVCDRILMTPNLSENVYYQAANILYNKIQFNFTDLRDSKARVQLKDSVLQHILRFRAGPLVVRKRVALCVAALMVVVPEWTDSIGTITKFAFDPSTALAYLEIISAFTEEFCSNEKLQISTEHRMKIKAQVLSYGKQLLDIFATYLKSTKDRQLQTKVFSCFHSWVTSGAFAVEDIVNSATLTAAFEGIPVPEFTKFCVESILSVITFTTPCNQYPQAVRTLVPRVLALVPLFDKATQDKNVELARQVHRIFVEVGESYLPFVLERSQEALGIVNTLVKSAGHRDKSISSHTFNFWCILRYEITEVRKGVTVAANCGQPLPANIPPHMNPNAHTKQQLELQLAFAPIFAKLILVLKENLKYLPNYESWSAETKDDWKEYRHVVTDTLLDSSAVVGTEPVLKMLWEVTQNELKQWKENSKNWHGFEASFHCIRSVARSVGSAEKDVIPKILQVLPSLNTPAPLRYTTTLLVGRYADWVGAHLEFASPMFGFVVQGLENPDTASSSALAFRHLCDACSKHCATHLFDNLLKVYSTYLAPTSRLPLCDQNEVIEGLSFVVSSRPENQFADGMHKMLLPMATELNTICGIGANKASAKPEVIKDATVRLAGALDRIAEVFRTISVEKADKPDVLQKDATEMTNKLWKLFEAVCNFWLDDSRIMEKLCRCFKYSLRLCETKFAPLLQPLLTLIANSFTKTPHSCFIYTASVCVDIFAENAEHHPLIARIVRFFAEKSFSILKDAEGFVEHPDIVEDFFDLIARVIRRAPAIVYTQPPFMQALVACALNGLSLNHKEGCAALHECLSALIGAGINNEKWNNIRHPSSPQPPPPAIVQALNGLLQRCGAELVLRLMGGICGNLPRKRMVHPVNVMEDIITFCGSHAHVWLQQAIAKVNDSIINKQEFMKQISGAADMRTVREALLHFGHVVQNHSG